MGLYENLEDAYSRIGGFAPIARSPREVDKVTCVVDNSVGIERATSTVCCSPVTSAQQAVTATRTTRRCAIRSSERLIMDNLRLQMAKKMGITVSDADLDRRSPTSPRKTR